MANQNRSGVQVDCSWLHKSPKPLAEVIACLAMNLSIKRLIPFAFVFIILIILYLVKEKEGGKKEEWEGGVGKECKSLEEWTSPSIGSVVSLCTGRQGEVWEGVAPEHLATAWASSIVSVPSPGQVTGQATSNTFGLPSP